MPKGPLYRPLKPVPEKLTGPFVQVFKLFDAFETTQNRLFLQKVIENTTVNSNLKNKVIWYELMLSVLIVKCVNVQAVA